MTKWEWRRHFISSKSRFGRYFPENQIRTDLFLLHFRWMKVCFKEIKTRARLLLLVFRDIYCGLTVTSWIVDPARSLNFWLSSLCCCKNVNIVSISLGLSWLAPWNTWNNCVSSAEGWAIGYKSWRSQQILFFGSIPYEQILLKSQKENVLDELLMSVHNMHDNQRIITDLSIFGAKECNHRTPNTRALTNPG